MSAQRRRTLTDFTRRLLAAGGVALVLLLSTLAVSPELHRLFHGHADGGAEDGCAVMQFAHGVSVAADTAVVAVSPVVWHAIARPSVAEVVLASPPFLLPPGCGPPAS